MSTLSRIRFHTSPLGFFRLTPLGFRGIAGNLYIAGASDPLSPSRWTGAAWSTVGGGTNLQEFALAKWDGKLIVGGTFTTVGGTVSANRIATWDGENWAALGAGVNSRVDSIVEWNGDLVAGGAFTEAGGVSSPSRVARWDGSSWTPMGTTTAEGEQNLVVWNGDLYVTGGILFGYIRRWTGSAWDTIATTNSVMRSIAVWDGKLVVGGDFTSHSAGSGFARIAAFDGSAWDNLNGGFASGGVFAITSYRGELIAGGSFASPSRIARWTGSAWAGLGGGMNSGVLGLTQYRGDLVAVGAFTSADSVANTQRVAGWDGDEWFAYANAPASLDWRAAIVWP